MKFLGRAWGPTGLLKSLYEESVHQQYSFEVSRKSLGTSRIVVQSLGKSGDQHDCCKSLGRV